MLATLVFVKQYNNEIHEAEATVTVCHTNTITRETKLETVSEQSQR